MAVVNTPISVDDKVFIDGGKLFSLRDLITRFLKMLKPSDIANTKPLTVDEMQGIYTKFRENK